MALAGVPELPLHPSVPSTSTGVPEVPGTSTGVPEVPSTSTGFEYSQCTPFFEAVQTGRWETAKDFYIQHPGAVRVRHPSSGKTALHIAVEAGHVDIVRELVSQGVSEDMEQRVSETMEQMEQDVSETMEQMEQMEQDVSEQDVSETMEQMEQGFEYSRCKPFFEAVQAGDWETARDFHIQHPEAVRVRHPFSGKTALHIAVEAGHVDIVRELVSLMEEDDLEIKSTGDDETALATAAMLGITEMAECMVTKNKKLLSIPHDFDDFPLLLACFYGQWHVARYLYSVTPLEDLMPDKGPHGAAIISNCFRYKEFDIPWDLINRCPQLAFTSNDGEATPLENFACMASSFRSGVELNFWQQWIYDSIDIQPPPRINHISVTVQNEENSQANNGRRSIRSGLLSPSSPIINKLGKSEV